MLFRIVQEALSNVWRHSQATAAQITVVFDTRTIRIIVKDDGQGFHVPKGIGDLAKDGKRGLAGMQERVRLINGTVTVTSEQGEGTVVIVNVPA